LETKEKNYQDVERFLSGIIIASCIIFLPESFHLGAILGVLIARGKV